MFYGKEQDVPLRFRHLTSLLGMLSRVDGVREELVVEIKAQIRSGTYLTEEKLNKAIHRLLCDVMANEERVS